MPGKRRDDEVERERYEERGDGDAGDRFEEKKCIEGERYE